MKSKLLLIIAILFVITSCKKKTEIFDFELIPVQAGDKWGYIDKEGKYAINPQFDEAMLLSSALALVKVDDKYGYISEDGKYVINPMYKEATNFNDGLACVVVENGFPSYINKKGEVLFTLNSVERSRAFHEGFAAVLIKGKWGFINTEGKIVIQPQFEGVSNFGDGFAVFLTTVKEEKLYGYINVKGEIVINAQFSNATSFNESLARIQLNEKFGFIDTEGKMVINPQFDAVSGFNEGLAIIRQGENYGFIDRSGLIVINPQFNMASLFNEKLAAIKSSDDKYGFINAEGKFEINPQFEEAGDFHNGLAYIKLGDKYGFIDTKGKIVINPQFDAIYGMSISNIEVESDYIDIASFIDLFLINTNQNMVRGISKETTLESLIETEHKGSTINEDTKTSVELKDEIIINEYAIIKNLNYYFSSNIYTLKAKYKYDYYWGYYKDGNSKSYNLSALVNGMAFSVELTDKAADKSESICKELSNYFSKLLEAKPVKVGEDDIIENEVMKVRLSNTTGYNSSNVIVSIDFL